MTIDALEKHLREQAARCVRAPLERFRHPWLSPMPPSDEAARWLARRAAGDAAPLPIGGDRFALGDYALGLFHHDVSESAIALPRLPELAEAFFGSLRCFLDGARDDGCIHRIELPHRVRDAEPAKPVMAQLALRVLDALGDEGLARFDEAAVLPKLLAFVRYLERAHLGRHGLLLTPSARASGFDSDASSAGFPERSIEGPDTNAFFVLELGALAELARKLGRDAVARELDAKAEELVERIERAMYVEDDDGGFYVALRGRESDPAHPEDARVTLRDPDGVSKPVATWTGLLPLYAGIPTRARAAAVARRVLDPDGYWGPQGVRTVPRTSPFFHQAARVMVYDPRRGEPGPVSNWSGPVWTLSNYYVARGLERYGFGEEARVLDARTVALLASDLARTGALHECYDDAGRGLWPVRGTFLSWNVLALVLPGPVSDPVLSVDRR